MSERGQQLPPQDQHHAFKMNDNVLPKLNHNLNICFIHSQMKESMNDSFVYLKSLASQPVIPAAVVSARLHLDNACSTSSPE